MSDPLPEFFDEMQRRLADRSRLLRIECRTLARQKLIIFSFAAATAVASVALVLYGLGRIIIDPSLSVAGLAELSGVGTGLVSGGFGWLVRSLRDRQMELDAQATREAEQGYMISCTCLIEDPILRDKIRAQIAVLASNSLYSQQQVVAD